MLLPVLFSAVRSERIRYQTEGQGTNGVNGHQRAEETVQVRPLWSANRVLAPPGLKTKQYPRTVRGARA
ncbi:hypothetical protein C9341_18030 [Escherichia coli]|nr:hypothetical protein [Escherichia coli]EFN5291828.1 hypothetical protein [Escherichia coli]TIZ00538.1 hypothetical protein C9343_21460 [Escherichia coli]TIZ19291.1 hypothetical protein C9341_18030 [Escherichia coli]TIZ31370.1 hypothetical protein C9342_22125 [Escherichia coli]